jgi:hypothetical protein
MSALTEQEKIGAVDRHMLAQMLERPLDASIEPLGGKIDELGRDRGDEPLEGKARPQAALVGAQAPEHAAEIGQ